ncbi:Uncharacterised protein [Segatella copri]|nr:Uncharacterised protein [Segatella copri]
MNPATAVLPFTVPMMPINPSSTSTRKSSSKRIGRSGKSHLKP